MSYKKHLNKFKKNELTLKPRLHFISPEKVDIIVKVLVFFLIFLSC